MEQTENWNGSVWEWCSDYLDFFSPNLCSVSCRTHLGWMIFLAKSKHLIKQLFPDSLCADADLESR